jgi:hypothetical protein
MLILSGICRQTGSVEFGEIEKKKFLKVWLEHETPPQGDRPGDLSIEEFLLPADTVKKVPAKGDTISLSVRCYAKGREVVFQALELLAGVNPSPNLKGA